MNNTVKSHSREDVDHDGGGSRDQGGATASPDLWQARGGGSQQPSWLMLEGASSLAAGCLAARQQTQPGLKPPAGWPLPRQLGRGALGVAAMGAAATHPSSTKRKEEEAVFHVWLRQAQEIGPVNFFKKDVFLKSGIFLTQFYKICHFSK